MTYLRSDWSIEICQKLTNLNAEFDILPIMNCIKLVDVTDVIHFDSLLFCPIYNSVSTRKWKSIGTGNSTTIYIIFTYGIFSVYIIRCDFTTIAEPSDTTSPGNP